MLHGCILKLKMLTLQSGDYQIKEFQFLKCLKTNRGFGAKHELLTLMDTCLLFIMQVKTGKTRHGEFLKIDFLLAAIVGTPDPHLTVLSSKQNFQNIVFRKQMLQE